MARNVRIVSGVPGQIERQQELADALTVRALRSRAPQQGGPVQVKMSPWEGVAQLGEAWIARKARGKADDLARADMERQKAANEAMIRQLAGEQGPRRLTEQGQPTGDPIEAPLDMETGRPMLLSDKAQTLAAAMGGMDPYQSGNALGGAMMQQALATPKYERVDLGDSIGVVDERGQVIHRIPKGATPDTRVREEGANARHAVPSGSAQLGAQTTMRGQDISAGTAIRGQDISASTARRGQDMTDARAQEAAGGGTAGSAYNPRQQVGLATQRRAALSLTSNLTGVPLAEVEAILAAEGPEGIERLINEKGDRFVQGAVARGIKAIPFVGDAIVDMANADMIAPAKMGGSGIAQFQNPTGPITTPDFIAGEAQFPNAVYPKEVQASMVRDILRESATSQGGRSQSGPLTFATEAEAEAAGIKPGTRVIIGGVPGTWQ